MVDYRVAGSLRASSIIGRTVLSSLKYLRTIIPLWVTA